MRNNINILGTSTIVLFSSIIVMVIGWINNFINVIQYALADSKLSDITTYTILQIVGIPFGPLGSILGIISWFN